MLAKNELLHKTCLSTSGCAFLSNHCSTALSPSHLFSLALLSVYSAVYLLLVFLWTLFCYKIVIWSPSVVCPNLLHGHCLFLQLNKPSSACPLTFETVKIHILCVCPYERTWLALSHNVASWLFLGFHISHYTHREAFQAITVTFH